MTRSRTSRSLLAENVRALRIAQDVSQERLAQTAGFHRTYVSQIELERVNLTLDNLDKLAAALGVEPHLLIRAQLEPRTNPK